MFFLLSSTFGIWRPLTVGLDKPSAGSNPAATVADPGEAHSGGYGVFIVVMPGETVDGDVAQPRILVNGEPVAPAALSRQLDALAERGARTAVLQPAASATLQDIVLVLDRARESRLADVTVSFR